MLNRCPSFFVLAVLLLVLGFIAPNPAAFAQITVDSALDDGTDCTLREAVLSANNNANEPGCSGAAGSNEIVFDAGLTGSTITLTSSDDTSVGPSALLISSTITIDGSNAPGLTISQSGGRRLFYVNSSGNL